MRVCMTYALRGDQDKVRARARILDVLPRWLGLCTMPAGGLLDLSSFTVFGILVLFHRRELGCYGLRERAHYGLQEFT